MGGEESSSLDEGVCDADVPGCEGVIIQAKSLYNTTVHEKYRKGRSQSIQEMLCDIPIE